MQSQVLQTKLERSVALVVRASHKVPGLNPQPGQTDMLVPASCEVPGSNPQPGKTDVKTCVKYSNVRAFSQALQAHHEHSDALVVLLTIWTSMHGLHPSLPDITNAAYDLDQHAWTSPLIT